MRLCGSRGTYAAAGFGAEEIAGYDVVAAGGSRQMGAVTVTAVGLPHDAAEPLAFVVSVQGVSLGHATDFGQVSRGMVEAFRSCDALLMESNYDPGMLRDGPYPARPRTGTARSSSASSDPDHSRGRAIVRVNDPPWNRQNYPLLPSRPLRRTTTP